MIDLTGKTILVTGGSRGIGAATVRQLVAQGGSVVVHFGSNLTAAQALAHEFGEPSIHLCQADLTSESETERLWDKAVAWHGRIDVLVNNAGIYEKSPLDLILIAGLATGNERCASTCWPPPSFAAAPSPTFVKTVAAC